MCSLMTIVRSYRVTWSRKVRARLRFTLCPGEDHQAPEPRQAKFARQSGKPVRHPQTLTQSLTMIRRMTMLMVTPLPNLRMSWRRPTMLDRPTLSAIAGQRLDRCGIS